MQLHFKRGGGTSAWECDTAVEILRLSEPVAIQVS